MIREWNSFIESTLSLRLRLNLNIYRDWKCEDVVVLGEHWWTGWDIVLQRMHLWWRMDKLKRARSLWHFTLTWQLEAWCFNIRWRFVLIIYSLFKGDSVIVCKHMRPRQKFWSITGTNSCGKLACVRGKYTTKARFDSLALSSRYLKQFKKLFWNISYWNAWSFIPLRSSSGATCSAKKRRKLKLLTWFDTEYTLCIMFWQQVREWVSKHSTTLRWATISKRNIERS